MVGPKVYWTQHLGASILPSLRLYQAFSRNCNQKRNSKSTNVTRIYPRLAEMQQGPFSSKLPDIHLYPINPQVCQTKVLFGRLPSELQLPCLL